MFYNSLHGWEDCARWWKMKNTLPVLVILACLTLAVGGQQYPMEPREPKITLFDSVDTIREFMRGETKQDYSDRNLIEVSLKFMEGHPRKGEAWVYRFGHKIPTRGTYLSIFHFTDGEIIEFLEGP